MSRPKTVKELMERARAAGHDALGIANDPEAWPRAHQLDAPDGPVCECGKPSAHESGWCGEKHNVHPKTGHDHALKKPPEWPNPNMEVTIRIARDYACDVHPLMSNVCSLGTKSCQEKHAPDEGDIWYAEISGIVRTDGADTTVTRVTHGYSIVHAAEMAADLLKLDYETCKDPEVDHCYCRDVTWSSIWDTGDFDEVVTRAKECCLCLTKTRVQEFEDP